MAQPRGHRAPAVLAAGDRAVTDVADDVRILEQGAEDVRVGLDQGPEDEPLRLEGRDVERRHHVSRPLRSGDDPLPGLAAAERHHAPVSLADALGHGNRRGVGRVDQADQLVQREGGEPPVHRCAGGFAGVTVTPPIATEQPADLGAGPSFRLPQADATDERAGGALLHRPHPEAAQRPVADPQRHRSPARFAQRRAGVADKRGDDRVRGHRLERVDIRLAEASQEQALRLDHGDLHSRAAHAVTDDRRFREPAES